MNVITLRMGKKSYKSLLWICVCVTGLTFLMMKPTINEESFLKFRMSEMMVGPLILKQDDPRLIQYIRDNYLQHPVQVNQLQQEVPKENPFGQFGQVATVEEYLGDGPGFFVEAGAWDGVHLSNTLYLEREKNWRGILVEPNAEAYRNLTTSGKRSPRSWAVNSCLSIHPYPQTVTFEAADVFSGIKDTETDGLIRDDELLQRMRMSLPESFKKAYPVQCLPLYSILLAAFSSSEQVRVDYFSLDVEGAEFSILKTIPWDKVDIRVISVEVQHSNSTAIEELMLQNGYKILKNLNADIIFAKEKK